MNNEEPNQQEIHVGVRHKSVASQQRRRQRQTRTTILVGIGVVLMFIIWRVLVSAF